MVNLQCLVQCVSANGRQLIVDSLLEAALTRQNLQGAWKRVKASKGAAGVDGLDIEHSTQLRSKITRSDWPLEHRIICDNYLDICRIWLRAES